MFKPPMTRKIIQVLGKQYSRPIIDHLTTKELLNAKNEPFKPDSIRKIVKGIQPNLIIEAEILTLVELKQHQAAELAEHITTKKKSILKKTK